MPSRSLALANSPAGLQHKDCSAMEPPLDKFRLRAFFSPQGDRWSIFPRTWFNMFLHGGLGSTCTRSEHRGRATCPACPSKQKSEIIYLVKKLVDNRPRDAFQFQFHLGRTMTVGEGASQQLVDVGFVYDATIVRDALFFVTCHSDSLFSAWRFCPDAGSLFPSRLADIPVLNVYKPSVYERQGRLVLLGQSFDMNQYDFSIRLWEYDSADCRWIPVMSFLGDIAKACWNLKGDFGQDFACVSVELVRRTSTDTRFPTTFVFIRRAIAIGPSLSRIFRNLLVQPDNQLQLNAVSPVSDEDDGRMTGFLPRELDPSNVQCVQARQQSSSSKMIDSRRLLPVGKKKRTNCLSLVACKIRDCDWKDDTEMLAWPGRAGLGWAAGLFVPSSSVGQSSKSSAYCDASDVSGTVGQTSEQSRAKGRVGREEPNLLNFPSQLGESLTLTLTLPQARLLLRELNVALKTAGVDDTVIMGLFHCALRGKRAADLSLMHHMKLNDGLLGVGALAGRLLVLVRPTRGFAGGSPEEVHVTTMPRVFMTIRQVADSSPIPTWISSKTTLAAKQQPLSCHHHVSPSHLMLLMVGAVWDVCGRGLVRVFIATIWGFGMEAGRTSEYSRNSFDNTQIVYAKEWNREGKFLHQKFHLASFPTRSDEFLQVLSCLVLRMTGKRPINRSNLEKKSHTKSFSLKWLRTSGNNIRQLELTM
ncbi:hypothetical protein AXG93_4905s1110 [Marchantia polymorpha subsp. ruderalis]|uniref:Uncharacterized protein n=1 Tax=Marchantia polymorpha subsp. ruderalis TaxID=1480154 RepID=A0A176VJB0_MARPO|nr:hypothetical protein AXG93_4905s1110 [Marchantia polymorpha subsp. ruderalis]